MAFSKGATADIIGATHTALVSEFASFNTPGVVDGRVEAIAVEGDTVFVGGTFTQIHDPLRDELVDQPYLFAYSKSSGDIIRSFDPVLNNAVLALEKTGEGTGVFAGGVFTNINGQIRTGLVKLDNNGDRVSGFSARPDAVVKTMVRLGDTLYIGGGFENITNTAVEHLAAIDTATGAIDPNLNLDFDGVITTRTATDTSMQSVDEVDITPDGRLLVIVGNFSIIDGNSRHRVAVIELEGTAAVSTWNTDTYDIQCPVQRFPQYIFGMDVSPDGSYFVTGSSGFRFRGDPACDTTNRFELDDLTNSNVKPTWTNYTGGDSVYEVVSTDHAVYIGGHFEFLDNDLGGGNTRGPGGTQRAGLAVLDPLNGLTVREWQSDRSPRGLGVFAMLSEDEGLYIGDDTDFLNGTEHKKLKFLPITSNVIARPAAPTLPTDLLSVVDGTLSSNSFDGTSIGATVELPGAGFNDVNGGVYIGGRLFQSSNAGEILVSSFEDGLFGNSTSVDLFGVDDGQIGRGGVISDNWALSDIGGMFFDYEWSRVYFTIEGNSSLRYRALSPTTPFFGNTTFIAEEQGDILWGDVIAMDVVGDHLYFARTDNRLYRADIDGAAVVSGTTVAISGPGIDGRDWDVDMLAFFSDAEPIGKDTGADIEFANSGSQTVGRTRSFEFDVVAGESVELRLDWLDPSAQVNLFIRDSNDVLVASDGSASGSPKFVTVPAGAGGTYIARVTIKEGSTSYTLQVNPDEGAPEPLADFEFASRGSNNSGRFQSFDFDVAAGELVEAQIIWDTLGADVRVFLRDEAGNQVARDVNNTDELSSLLSVVAETSGEWSVAVATNSDSVVGYDILVDTSTDFVLPEPLADFEFSSVGSNASGRFQRFDIDVAAGDLVEALVTWDSTGRDVRVWLRDEDGEQIARDTDNTTGISSMLSVVAETGGVWTVAVQTRSDDVVSYDVLVDIDSDFVPPAPLADFEFSSSGSNNSGRFQTFDFDVAAGETVDAQVLWGSVGPDVRVWLRDANGEQVARDTANVDASSTMLSVVAAIGGEWSIAVQTRSDDVTNYDVLVNTN